MPHDPCTSIAVVIFSVRPELFSPTDFCGGPSSATTVLGIEAESPQIRPDVDAGDHVIRLQQRSDVRELLVDDGRQLAAIDVDEHRRARRFSGKHVHDHAAQSGKLGRVRGPPFLIGTPARRELIVGRAYRPASRSLDGIAYRIAGHAELLRPGHDRPRAVISDSDGCSSPSKRSRARGELVPLQRQPKTVDWTVDESDL